MSFSGHDRAPSGQPTSTGGYAWQSVSAGMTGRPAGSRECVAHQSGDNRFSGHDRAPSGQPSSDGVREMDSFSGHDRAPSGQPDHFQLWGMGNGFSGHDRAPSGQPGLPMSQAFTPLVSAGMTGRPAGSHLLNKRKERRCTFQRA